MNQDKILLAIILVPLFGALISYFSAKFAAYVASFAALISFGLVCSALLQMNPDIALEYSPKTWFEISSFSVKWGFRFDQLSAVMCLLISGVGSLIHIFSIGYMGKDPSAHRFFAYLNLFLASMFLLVLGSNLLVLFIGWEGVGLCSFLLIGFWFENANYAKAAQKAFVMNRIGDLGLLLAMFVIFYNFNTLEFTSIVAAAKTGSYQVELFSLIASLLLLGAFGKSAQIPLFTWLPDAMAGPTPVSALIHAATMVTAGIYLVARMFPIFDIAVDVQLALAVIATATAVVTATIALVQTDIKKVLAYSTVSQLGFMFVALASGAYWVAIFHVLTHGFFKACLFLSAGSVIHGCHHEQDMRKMGGLYKTMPITFLSFSIATFAIAGIAPFAGYYSKHAIIESFSAMIAIHPEISVLGTIISVTSFLTAFYMGRCWILTFFGSYKGEHKAHEVPSVMWLPVLGLAILSIAGGVFLEQPLYSFLSKVLPATPHMEHSSFIFAIKSSWVGVLGLVLALVCFLYAAGFTAKIGKYFSIVQTFLRRSYFIDEIYNCLIVRPLYWIGWLLWKVGDELFLLGTERSAVMVTRFGSGICSILQSGQIRHYAAVLLLGLAGLAYLLIHGF